MVATYSDKLKDPRWQKKRLEIFDRDKWTCKVCCDTKNTLAVHHKRYINGNDPWDYDNEDLITVCDLCHSIIENCKSYPNYAMEKLRAYCIVDGEEAVVFYIYENRPPVVLMKRGAGVRFTNHDIKEVRKILKIN
jgi:hypothetical protein